MQVGSIAKIKSHRTRASAMHSILRYTCLVLPRRFWYENNVQGYMRYMGMFGISLTQGWVRHTGDHYSTKPSYQYANEKLAKVQMANRGLSK